MKPVSPKRQRKVPPPDVIIAHLRARLDYSATLIETAIDGLVSQKYSIATVAGELRREAKTMREAVRKTARC